MEYITAVKFRWVTGYVCQAASVKYLELCDKYSIGWVRKRAPGRAQNLLAGSHFRWACLSKMLLRYF